MEKIVIEIEKMFNDEFFEVEHYLYSLPQGLQEEFRLEFQYRDEGDPYYHRKIKIEVNPRQRKYSDEERKKVRDATSELVSKLFVRYNHATGKIVDDS